MRRAQTLALLAGLISWPATGETFSGESALRFTSDIVAFGPRTVGSEGHGKVERFIEMKLRSFGCQVSLDVFDADTPIGQRTIKNIVAAVPGRAGKAVAVSGHYDTKVLGGNFLGANDGGSSTGFLLELARVSCGKPRADGLLIVFFDGEEAIREWSDTDSLYGSRHLAAKWTQDGTAQRLKALINVDMIGDRKLVLPMEMYSTDWLRRLVWDTATELGYAAHFHSSGAAIGDDHLPFLQAGIPAVDLIDFNYGPNNAWWHTDEDTLDKLDARSFQVIGAVVLAVVKKLENRNP